LAEDVRTTVPAGPGGDVGAAAAQVLPGLIGVDALNVAPAGTGHRDARFRDLGGAVCAVMVAGRIAACYCERWHAETTYKIINPTLRGYGWRIRGQSPDLAEQEIWPQRSLQDPKDHLHDYHWQSQSTQSDPVVMAVDQNHISDRDPSGRSRSSRNAPKSHDDVTTTTLLATRSAAVRW
jgi:hypothetical protein